MECYDVIVLGLGGIGSAVLYHLAARGTKVLGIDRFPPGHDRGSSHGQTRIIRQAYFEHPDYVPLVLRSYQLWRELEACRGGRLLHQVGLVQVGPPQGEVISGVLRSAAQHHLSVEKLTARQVERRWRALRVADPAWSGVFEAQAGYLEVENCIQAYYDEARKRGATASIGEEVRQWQVSSGVVRVRTGSSGFVAKRLVIAAGAWSPQLLGDLGIPLRVVRKPMFWYRPAESLYEPGRCPCFLFETPAGEFYGFPNLAPHGVKVAEHTGGEVVDDPLCVARELRAGDLARVHEFITTCLPALGTQLTHHTVCMYTLSPDRHFVADRHPRHDEVFYVAGLSGHGFKFAPALGEALADLALEGRTELPIGFLGAGRFKASGGA
jgi:sarcosine oxidase